MISHQFWVTQRQFFKQIALLPVQSYYDRLKDIAEEDSETEKSAQPVAPAAAAKSASTTTTTTGTAGSWTGQPKIAQAVQCTPAAAATGALDSSLRKKAIVGGSATAALPSNARNPRKACLYTGAIHPCIDQTPKSLRTESVYT